ESIKKGTIISTVFAVIVAGGCYFLGGFGRLSGIATAADASGAVIPAEGFDAVVPGMLSKLPDLLIAVVVILVLSASMSTLSSLVIASSSTLTIDLLKGTFIKKMDEKKQVFIIRVFVVVFIAVSAIIAVYQVKSSDEAVKYIAQLMGVSWGALAGAFLAPFLYGLYWKKTTKIACWASFAFGAGIMVLNMLARSIFPAFLQSPINCGAFAMIAGLIIVPIVSLFTKKQDKAVVDAMFSCYDQKVEVSQKTSLTD
ncbi:MAG: sodium:solute symporter, partial [Clostridia bacterium]|nr:sodium:solute symporter [Clostridia bacterium]